MTTKQRKVHLVTTQEDVAIEDTRTACEQPTKRRSVTDDPADVTCADCIIVVGGVPAEATEAEAEDDDRPEAVTVAPATDGKLEGDALIERKRLAGAGRSQEAGTAFGSRWTDAERAELLRLWEETGWNRAAAATTFVEANPHRTRQAALYQIDRNLTKPVSE